MSESRRNPLELERARLGELSEAHAARVRSERHAELRALEAEDRVEQKALFEKLSPAAFRKRVEARVEKAPAKPALVWAPMLAVAVALLMWAVPSRETQRPNAAEVTRTKGMAPVLQVFRKRGKDSEELHPGAHARANDVLQLRYAAAGRPYGLILSLDGASAVTVHVPGPGLEPSGAHLLDRAYVLDTAPGFERFVLITSANPFDPAQVIQAAETLARDGRASTAPLALPEGLEQTSFLLRKDVP
jgi:hypothetical protein